MLCFLMLSRPAHVRDGVFGVLQGTADGVELKEFATMAEARLYHEQLIMCLNMAIDLPVQLIRIDDEASFPILRERFEEAHEQRLHEHRSFVLASRSIAHLCRRYADKAYRFFG